jgi:CheY-like chemotaxis protein
MASAHALPHLPTWLVSACAALVVGVLLRLLDPTLRARGERIARRFALTLPAPSGLTRSVLIVEDHAASGELLASLLRDALDVPVHLARTGAEGRGMAQRYRPAAVLCDLALPDEDGADVLAAIGLSDAVLMSGAAHEEDLRAAAARCHAVAIPKPVEAARLVAEARRMLAAVAH